jgi:hypothetical protein
MSLPSALVACPVTAEILVELEDLRTGDNQSTQHPGDEQAIVLGAIVD